MIKFIKKIAMLLFLFLPLFFMPIHSLTANSSVNMEELEQIDKAGTYPVSIYLEDKDGNIIEKQIMVTILFPHSNINEENQEGIDARDFKIKEADFWALNAQGFIQISGAHAWNTIDGNSIAIQSVMTKQLTETKYEVEFKTAKGTSTIIQVWLFDDDFLIADGYLNNLSFFNTNKNIQITKFLLLLLGIPVILVLFGSYLIYYSNQRVKKLLYFIQNNNKNKEI